MLSSQSKYFQRYLDNLTNSREIDKRFRYSCSTRNFTLECNNFGWEKLRKHGVQATIHFSLFGLDLIFASVNAGADSSYFLLMAPIWNAQFRGYGRIPLSIRTTPIHYYYYVLHTWLSVLRSPFFSCSTYLMFWRTDKAMWVTKILTVQKRTDIHVQCAFAYYRKSFCGNPSIEI